MDSWLQEIFYREVERQCTFALMAYEDMKQARAIRQVSSELPPQLQTRPRADRMSRAQWEERGQAVRQHMQTQSKRHEAQTAAGYRVWFSVQAFLVAAANVSKLLWPNPEDTRQFPERGPELRATLEMAEDCPLKPPRTFRNHFEHFDARLEKWAASSPRRNFIDSNIGPGCLASGGESRDHFRNFDTTTFTVTFWGETYDLPPIAEAIEQLWRKATAQLQGPTSRL
jgi:hypothetical protein